MAVCGCASDRRERSGCRLPARAQFALDPPARAFWACAAVAATACSPRQISDSGFGAYEVSLAAWSDGLALAWYDTRDGNAEIYVRSLDAEGRESGPELRLTTTAAASYEADIAPLPDGFAI